MQATVRTFDPRTRTGDVLLDDGRAVAFGARAFDASGLRLLRLGQRVRLRLDAGGSVLFLTIATLPDPGGPDHGGPDPGGPDPGGPDPRGPDPAT